MRVPGNPPNGNATSVSKVSDFENPCIGSEELLWKIAWYLALHEERSFPHTSARIQYLEVGEGAVLALLV